MAKPLPNLSETLANIRFEIGKIIIGQSDVIDQSLIAIFAGQHALIEGVPGVAKTLLVRTLAKVLDGEFQRIQFTPDLMPSDITGTNIFDMKKQDFKLLQGPVFTSFLLADEINRAPAKTQSALLQAMQERVVTIDQETYQLPENFTVFATQNPIDHEGTYPLPEAQKDRFMLKIRMDYPNRDEEVLLAQATLGAESPEVKLERGDVAQVLSQAELLVIRKTLQTITIREELVGYVVDLIRATRIHETIAVGAGPRALQALLLSSRVVAAMAGRDFVTPDDIRSMCLPVLEHRLILRPEYEIEGLTVGEVVVRILEQIAVPR